MMKLTANATLTAILLCVSIKSIACTDFRLTAQDGTIVIARSLEFAQDLKSSLMTSPRGKKFSDTAPDGKPGMNWTAKYGYVFLDALDSGITVDGMNEQGLSVEALYLPNETQYQTVPDGKDNQAIAYFHLGDWILGNFKTVDEVKQALPTVYVFSQALPQFNNFVFPIHFAVYDNSGKGLVIEFINGKLTTYDNEVGVMTNSPAYSWHITNLRNYVNLTPAQPKPIIDNGIKFIATGQGAGMMGLPGDISPPSRFVKVSIMKNTVLAPNNANEAVNIAQHIINNVDIPLGFVREGQASDKASSELTQWVVFKDLTHKMFYYRTYGDLTLHAVDLTKLNLAENSPILKMPITSKQYVMDMTKQFMGAGK